MQPTLTCFALSRSTGPVQPPPRLVTFPRAKSASRTARRLARRPQACCSVSMPHHMLGDQVAEKGPCGGAPQAGSEQSRGIESDCTLVCRAGAASRVTRPSGGCCGSGEILWGRCEGNTVMGGCAQRQRGGGGGRSCDEGGSRMANRRVCSARRAGRAQRGNRTNASHPRTQTVKDSSHHYNNAALNPVCQATPRAIL